MSESLAICARVEHHGLIAAECAALTGGRPDVDGVARCDDISSIPRAAYVQTGLHVLTWATDFDDLVDRVAALPFDADRFRIDVHDPSARLTIGTTAVAIALADVIATSPDLSDPRHRFVVVATADGLAFGRVDIRTDAGYRIHDTKPWTTSASLDSRFARALVNLVPSARSILDPCCGAGSIVLEAASLGLDAFGVDWKPAMVGMTTQNLAHFGCRGTVVRADSRVHVQLADAIVTDLPYGHALEADETTIRAIIEQAATLAPAAVFVAPGDLSVWFEAAGYTDIETCRVVKRRGFTRWVHTMTSTRCDHLA